MTRGTLTCKSGLLSCFVLISYIGMTSSMSLNLNELRNKVSNIKVNQRGSLWATGHFMGKKSVDSSFLESSFGGGKIPFGVQSANPERKAESLTELLIEEVLKRALQTPQKRGFRSGGGFPDEITGQHLNQQK
uniref:Neuromedin Bb n=1 Tax=Salmo trutta TaxID=8032 RepID=A0A674CU48_SALTR